MILFLTILVIILLAWIVFHPAWAPPVPENVATKAITKGAGEASRSAGGWWKGFRAAVTGRDEDLAQKFQTWVTDGGLAQVAHAAQDEDVNGLAVWLGDMTTGQAALFMREMAAFLKPRGLKLAWMLDEKVDAELRQTVQGAVVFYALAMWKAHSGHARSVFMAWQAAPTSRRRRGYTQALYARLVEKGLASQPPAELLMAPDKERQVFIIKAIEQAAEKTPDAFAGTIKEV